MAALGREAQRVGIHHYRFIARALATARDAERLAKIRSGKLPVDDDELEAVLAEDRRAQQAWNPCPEGLSEDMRRVRDSLEWTKHG